MPLAVVAPLVARMLQMSRRSLGPLVLALVLCLGGLAAGGCDKRGDEGFVVLMGSSPSGLDPRFVTSDASAKLVGLLHAGLVTVDTRSGEPKLELAASIDQPTPTRYEVTLREDVYFHDGHPVTTEDVRYTLMKLDSELVGSPYAGTQRRIASFERIDEKRFVLELEEPHAPFLTSLSLGIVPKHVCAGHEECPKTIGAGPFAFVSREGNHRYVFRGFDRYFEGAPKIDKLVFKVVEDSNTRLLALLGGTADLVQNAVSPMMLPVVRDAKGLKIETDQSFKYSYLAFNLEHDLLDDVRVRRAIAYGIDRKSIVEHKFRGHATLSTGMLAPSHWAYESDVTQYAYRPGRARELLDDAGYPKPGPDQPRFRVEFKVSSDRFRRSIVELMADQLGRIGIEVKVRSYEWGTFFHDIKSRNFAMTTLQWPSVIEPGLYRWIFHSENIPTAENRSAGANRGAYRNERVDRLLDRGEEVTERAKRREIYSTIQTILARDLPYVSLWHEDNIAIMKEGVEDYYITPNARFEALEQAVPPDDDH
jgi:peptide/nickel transport system substrate-binding protein